MKFAVVQLKENGRRLSRDEITAASVAVGDLLISDWLQGNAEKRALRMAQVVEHYASVDRNLLTTLFDPVIIRMEARWFVLKGYQLDSIGGVVTEYAQEWLVRVVTPEIEAAVHATAAATAAAVPHPHQRVG